jgi:MFS family permease
LFAVMAILPATANTTIITRQLLLTPDDLRGRLSSVLGLLTGIAATLGPILGGLLASAVSGTVAVLVCAGGIAAIAVVATLNSTLRSFPRSPLVAKDQGIEFKLEAEPIAVRRADQQHAPTKGE